MTKLEEMEAKMRRLIPDEMRAHAVFPLPWEDEDGIWHEPAKDAIAIRIANASLVVDAYVRGDDLDMPDELFSDRIMKPMLACLDSEAIKLRADRAAENI